MTSTAQFPRESSARGSFERQPSLFRDWVRADGSGPYPAAPGRYQLYVSKACPWAHRTLIVRRLKGLEQAIGLSVVDPLRDERGWRFEPEPDPCEGFRFLAEAYRRSEPSFSGRVTVPVLWDRETGRIVNNESADLIRILGAEFDAWAERPELELYPAALRDEIDALNEWIYRDVNNGVYRAGFATRQAAYEEAVRALFAALDRLEERLATRRFLCGSLPTEADWRLFPTLLRFDSVYVGHFKCSLRRLVDYPNLWAYTRDLYQVPGVAETVDFDHIKRHYYATHERINPTRIVPLGPDLDLWAPPAREELSA